MKKNGAWRKTRVFSAAVLLVGLAARLASRFTARGTDSDWYRSVRPAFTPPGGVFAVVWSVLYLLLAVCLYLAWTGHRGLKRAGLAALFGTNLALNVAWTYLYFSRRDPAAAFPVLAALLATILLVMIFCRHSCRPVTWLMLPYLLWVFFAGALNRLSY